MKTPLLYLCHRIPFPPNKGDKIRSFNILKYLSKEFDVYLGCFIDDPNDHQYQSELMPYCREVKAISLNPTYSKVKGLTKALLSNLPITVPYYSNSDMQHWVNKTIEDNNISKCLIFSSSMAQFVEQPQFNDLQKVIDFVDMDSDKWLQYAQKKAGPMKWLYTRESRTLGGYEKSIAKTFDASVFVSDKEAGLFKQFINDDKCQVVGINNGIDSDFFNPNEECLLEEDIPLHPKAIIFTGAMDYWANINAVEWFIEQCWPTVLEHHPESYFYIVGSNPPASLQKLNGHNNIIVTGRVEDMRPYLKNACLAIAPLQIARGIQNKILEAMSMGCQVVATSQAFEGLADSGKELVHIHNSANEFSQTVINLINQLPAAEQNRQWVINHYSWGQSLKLFSQYL